MKKKKQRSKENSKLEIPKTQEVDNSAISSSSNIKANPQNLLENSMNKTLETIQKELNRDPNPEKVDKSGNNQSNTLNTKEETTRKDINSNGSHPQATTSEDIEINLESGQHSNILDEIDQVNQEVETQKQNQEVDNLQQKEVKSGPPAQKGVIVTPKEELIPQRSLEIQVTQEIEDENTKLEKLLYKLKGDFRSKILKEKNVKIWSDYYTFFKTEFEFIINSEKQKSRLLSDLGVLERKNSEIEQQMIQSLEAEDQSRADHLQETLTQLHQERKIIEEQIDNNDQREEDFKTTGNCKKSVRSHKWSKNPSKE